MLIIVGYLVTIQTCENLNVLMFCPHKKTLNIIPTLNLLDLDSNPRPVPPDMAPAKKPKYISIYLWDDEKKMCALKKTKRFVRIYVLKIKDKKDYLNSLFIVSSFYWSKDAKLDTYYWSWFFSEPNFQFLTHPLRSNGEYQ